MRIGVDPLAAVAGSWLTRPTASVAGPAHAGADAGLVAEVVEVELPLYAEMSAGLPGDQCCARHSPPSPTGPADAVGRLLRGHPGHRRIRCFYSAADYVQAQRVRRIGIKQLAELYQDVDLLLTPTSSAPAPTFAEMRSVIRGLYTKGASAVHKRYWDAVGNPVLTVPIGPSTAGLPLAMQLIGRPFDEPLVLRAGDAFQQATHWHLRPPPIATEAHSARTTRPLQ